MERSMLLLPLLLLLLLLAGPARGLIDEELREQFEGAAEQRRPLLRTNSAGSVREREFSFEQPQVVDLRPEAQRALQAAKPQTYGVIVDCGSSGTRAHIYHWDTDIDFSLQMLHDIEPLREPGANKPASLKVEPGLAQLAASGRAERQAYIRPLIEFVAARIPESRHKFTGVYFMATAGMRLLEPNERESIMRDVRAYVRANYHFAKVETSVISGTDEGMYQWININARGKRFLTTDTNMRTRTYAVLEMGGASIQITYQLKPGTGELVAQALEPRLRPIYWRQVVEPAICRSDVLEHNYMLHSTTFLGLGINSATEAYRDLLIHEQTGALAGLSSWSRRLLSSKFSWQPKGAQKPAAAADAKLARAPNEQQQQQQQQQKPELAKLTFEDPCLPRGYKTSEPLIKPTRMLTKQAKQRQTIGYTADEHEQSFAYNLVGTASYVQCKRLVNKMLALAKREKLFCDIDTTDSCTMPLLGERFVPFQRFDFIAISGFYYAFSTNIFGNSELYERESIKRKLKRICNMNYEQLKILYPSMEEKHLVMACFRAIYADAFLTKGLRMPDDFDLLEMKNKINGDDLDWTMGAILDKSLAIEHATEEAQVEAND